MGKISVFGLGKLGCTMLSCFAHKGWEVIGVDLNKDFVEEINAGGSPIYEPGVDELIKDNRDRMKATTNAEEAVLGSDVSFIIVPTPSVEDGSFTSKYVENVIKAIAQSLTKKNTYHLVVVTSTVMPGETERMGEILEEVSGRKIGVNLGLCYNPDFIALGSVIRDFLNPDMILIGESDKKAGEILSNIHRNLVNNNPTIHKMSLNNAELGKIGLNAYCTMKITFANVMGEICENMPTGDAHKVLDAIGSDSRVGNKYFKPGLGFAGPCFCRDNRAFALSASKVGVINVLSDKVDYINEYHKKIRIPNKVYNLMKDLGKKTLSILGMTYKENTTLVEESAVIDLILHIPDDITTKIYDPSGLEESYKALAKRNNVIYCSSAEECLEDSDICFVGTPWPEFKDKSNLNKLLHDKIVVDAWGIIPKDICGEYIKIGKN